jgi:hypothetical protein
MRTDSCAVDEGGVREALRRKGIAHQLELDEDAGAGTTIPRIVLNIRNCDVGGERQ